MAVEFYTMCGGFLFLGIFLGLLFLLATVLIIYYKQVSEGYEDQRRYQIMQQVGMSPGEVALSIRGQILLVFFLPLLTAGLHILVAFPMICCILELFSLYDTRLFALCGGDPHGLCRCVCHGVRSDGPHLRAYCGRHRVSR